MHATGHPGIAPTWTSSAKDMVGCALGAPRLWFTTGFGILNEVYYPRVDIPQIRDLGFIVADGRGFWVEVKRFAQYETRQPGPGIPAVEIVHRHPRFELTLRIAPDVQRDALLIDVVLTGDNELRPYALLAPHLGGTGNDNWVQATYYHGRAVLWAEQGPFGLALAAVTDRQRDAWGPASAGYVGVTDGWQDFNQNGQLTWQFETAGPGNVALIGELPRRATLALGFGSSKESAATLAYSALTEPFETSWDEHVEAWRAWQAQLRIPQELPDAIRDQVAISAMVLRVHQDKTYPGAMVASLSVPWGNTRDDIGGYHLVWPRDLVESAGGLLALGAITEARSILRYLVATQHHDGHWSQNMWLGGKSYWKGMQLDEAGFPVLLAAAVSERGALNGVEIKDMVTRALGFIARNGPATDQDRWEEDAGINTFTLAVCIAALVCGSPFIEEPARSFVLSLADYWNAHIEEWTSVGGTRLAREVGVDAYYIRIRPGSIPEKGNGFGEVLPIRNRAHDPQLAAEEQVATDFLQLVRFGLRRADDPVIRASVKVIDHQLKVDTPTGTTWRRYTGDGYGEHRDGAAFDGTGVGRPWPLLAGERGHFELAAGHDPLPYLDAMTVMTGRCGLIPEQIWDSRPIEQRNLFPGKPSGSAMPLVWAHAEFIKLAMSRALGRPFDTPSAVRNRYEGKPSRSAYTYWSQRFPIREMRAAQILRICLPAPAIVHWGIDGWREPTDAMTRDTGLGLHTVDLPSQSIRAGQCLDFTFRWSESGQWAGQDYRVDIV